MLNAYKELVPVVYDESSIKLLWAVVEGADKMCFGMHWHDRMEINLIVSGSMILHSEDGHYEVKPGQIVISAPRTMHCGITGEKGVKYHTIMFDVEKFCNSTPASEKYLTPILNQNIIFPRVIEDEELKNAIKKLVQITKDNTKYHPLKAEGKIYDILAILSQYSVYYTKTTSETDKRFNKILEYVSDNFTDKITPKNISIKFGYNETYFCRRFKELTGLTFTKYVKALRMEMAIKLLKSGKEEIRYIAWKCGYEDVSYFSNCFNDHFGFRPSQIHGKER